MPTSYLHNILYISDYCIIQYYFYICRYGEPIRFGLKWSVYGFFWLKAEDKNKFEKYPIIGNLFAKPPKERLLQLWVVSTVGMLRDVYVSNGMLLRRNVHDNKILKDRKHNYTMKGM